MSKENIIGYYKQWLLVELNGVYYVVRRKDRVILKGTESYATKAFGLLIAGAITEEDLENMGGA